MTGNSEPPLLREALRFLWFAREVGVTEKGEVDIATTIQKTREMTGVSAYSPDPNSGMECLVELLLAKKTRLGLRLNFAGLDLANLGEGPTLLSARQRTFLLEHLIMDAFWSIRIRNLLAHFRRSDDDELVLHLADTHLGKEDTRTLILFQEMRLVTVAGSDLLFDKGMVHLLADYKYSSIPITQNELENILRERKEMANRAEEFIVQWEEARLQSAGYPELRKLVTRVSQADAGRGYDIHSVDGDQGSEEDRFIEVKCSVGEAIAFFWSSREIEVATRSGKRYWIYFVPNARILSPETQVCAIQDPANLIDVGLTLQPSECFVQGESLASMHHESIQFDGGYRGLLWYSKNSPRTGFRESPSRDARR